MRRLAILLPLLALAAPATAGRMKSKSLTVAYADLDLSSDAGRATLDRRIAVAARQVCGTTDIRDLRGMIDRNRCRVEARASAAPLAARVAAKHAARQVAGI